MTSIGTTMTSMAVSQGPNGRIGSTKGIILQFRFFQNFKLYVIQLLANYWCIANLRPAPPLRPSLLNQSTSGSGGGSSNALSSYCSGRKNQPNFEEDALVLRVIEAYCAAYQNNARNTIHSGELQLNIYICRLRNYVFFKFHFCFLVLFRSFICLNFKSSSKVSLR